MRQFELFLIGKMAEWSKALCLGLVKETINRSSQERGFESHSCHFDFCTV